MTQSAAMRAVASAPESEPSAWVARVPSALSPAAEAEAAVAVACLVSGRAVVRRAGLSERLDQCSKVEAAVQQLLRG